MQLFQKKDKSRVNKTERTQAGRSQQNSTYNCLSDISSNENGKCQIINFVGKHWKKMHAMEQTKFLMKKKQIHMWMIVIIARKGNLIVK